MNEIVDVQSVQSDLDGFDYDRMISDPDDREWAETAAGFITFGLGQAVVKVLEAGNLLIEAKQRLAHGEYLPWVEQACGLKPSYAAKLVKAAQWVNVEHAPHLDGITDATTLFLLSADATPEDVRQWALERCAAGNPPTRKEVQERKRQAQGKPERTLTQEVKAVLKISPEARQLAAKAEHITTRQLMDELDADDLPKGTEHQSQSHLFLKNGTGWWKLPHQQPVEAPVSSSRSQADLSGEEVPLQEVVTIEEASVRMGYPKAHSLRNRITPSRIAKDGNPRRNGWEALPHVERGKCIVRRCDEFIDC